MEAFLCICWSRRGNEDTAAARASDAPIVPQTVLIARKIICMHKYNEAIIAIIYISTFHRGKGKKTRAHAIFRFAPMYLYTEEQGTTL